MKNQNMSSDKVSVREKLIITLVIFLIQMLKPWEYSHQFTTFWDEIKQIFNTVKEPTKK